MIEAPDIDSRLNTAETDVTLILGRAVATHALYHFQDCTMVTIYGCCRNKGKGL